MNHKILWTIFTLQSVCVYSSLAFVQNVLCFNHFENWLDHNSKFHLCLRFFFSYSFILQTEMNINLYVLRRDSMDAFQKCVWFSQWLALSGGTKHQGMILHRKELVCIPCYFLVCHLYPCGWKPRLVVREART